MWKKRRITVAICTLLGLVGVIVVVTLLLCRDSPLTKRLPDGSLLKIVDVYYGTNHHYVEWDRPRWKVFIGNHIPASLAARTGWLPMGVGPSFSTPPGEPALFVSTLYKTPRSNAVFPRLHGDFFDENGIALSSELEQTSGQLSDSNFSIKIMGWSAAPVPYASKRITLRISEMIDGERGGKILATFSFPNPANTNSSP
jgi:hypothetical protein